MAPTTPLFFCLALLAAVKCDIVDDIFGGIREAWNWFWENILKPIVDTIIGAIKGVVDAIGTSLGNLTGSLFEAVTYPVRVLSRSWDIALNTLQHVLGPLAFLSPLVLAGIFAGFALLVWYVIKSIVPVI